MLKSEKFFELPLKFFGKRSDTLGVNKKCSDLAIRWRVRPEDQGSHTGNNLNHSKCNKDVTVNSRRNYYGSTAQHAGS